jgi:hypothetical protein
MSKPSSTTSVLICLALWLPIPAVMADGGDGAERAKVQSEGPAQGPQVGAESAPPTRVPEPGARAVGAPAPPAPDTQRNRALVNPCHGSPQPRWCNQ